MDPHDILHRHAKKSEGIVVTQVLLGGIGDILDIRQGFDPFRRHPGRRQALMVKRHVLVTVVHQRTQTLQLKPLQVGAAHTFPFRVPDSLFHVVHPVL